MFKPYTHTIPACIRNGNPACPALAIIANKTVEHVSNLKGICNAFVHITDNNTTVYLDDKGNQTIIWNGPVTINDYDIDENPLNLRNQLLSTTINGGRQMIYFDAQKTPFLLAEGSNDYTVLSNKPSINSVTLEGDKTLEELGIYQDDQIWGFDTVADMKASTNLVDGSYARTLGYYAKNDGGGALYKIRTVTNEDVVDDKKIIGGLTNAQLIAELNAKKEIKLSQLGASTSTGDNSSILAYALTNYDKVCIDDEYHFASSINITNSDKDIYGLGQIIYWDGSDTLFNLNDVNRVRIHDLQINCSNNNALNFNGTLANGGCADCEIRSITIRGANIGVKTVYSWDDSFHNVRIHNSVKPIEIGNQSNAILFSSCQFSSFSSTMALTNAEGIEFNNCDITIYSGSGSAIRLYQTSLTMINCYYEGLNSEHINITIQENESYPSTLNIIGGKITNFPINVYPAGGKIGIMGVGSNKVRIVNLTYGNNETYICGKNITALDMPSDYYKNRYNSVVYFDGSYDVSLSSYGSGANLSQTFANGQKTISVETSGTGFSVPVTNGKTYLLEMDCDLPTGQQIIFKAGTGATSRGIAPVNGKIIVPIEIKFGTSLYFILPFTEPMYLSKLHLWEID